MKQFRRQSEIGPIWRNDPKTMRQWSENDAKRFEKELQQFETTLYDRYGRRGTTTLGVPSLYRDGPLLTPLGANVVVTSINYVSDVGSAQICIKDF